MRAIAESYNRTLPSHQSWVFSDALEVIKMEKTVVVGLSFFGLKEKPLMSGDFVPFAPFAMFDSGSRDDKTSSVGEQHRLTVVLLTFLS